MPRDPKRWQRVEDAFAAVFTTVLTIAFVALTFVRLPHPAPDLERGFVRLATPSAADVASLR